MPRVLIIVLTLLGVALPIEADVTYRFTTKSTAALRSSSTGRVWIDGNRKRVELDPDPTNPRTSDITITVDGKTTFINLQNSTYYNERKASSQETSRGSSSLFHLPWPDDRVKGRPKISYRNEGEGPAFGEHTTTKHRIQFEYRVIAELQGTPLQGDVSATVILLTVPALERDLDAQIVQTGFPKIDEELARLLSTTAGMIVRSEVSISRTLEGGPIVTETTTTAIDEWKTTDVEDRMFAIPSGLTYQEPVYGTP